MHVDRLKVHVWMGWKVCTGYEWSGKETTGREDWRYCGCQQVWIHMPGTTSRVILSQLNWCLFVLTLGFLETLLKSSSNEEACESKSCLFFSCSFACNGTLNSTPLRHFFVPVIKTAQQAGFLQPIGFCRTSKASRKGWEVGEKSMQFAGAVCWILLTGKLPAKVGVGCRNASCCSRNWEAVRAVLISLSTPLPRFSTCGLEYPALLGVLCSTKMLVLPRCGFCGVTGLFYCAVHRRLANRIGLSC